MTSNLVEFFYFGMLGIYVFCTGVLLYCFYKLNIKETLNYLALSTFCTFDVIITLYVMSGLDTEESMSVLPFSLLILLLSYETLFRINETRFNFKNPNFQKFLIRTLMVIMAVMSFFFPIEGVRELFIVPKYGAEIISGFVGGFVLSVYAKFVVVITCAAVLYGAFKVWLHSHRNKVYISPLYYTATVLCLLGTVHDSLMTLNLLEFFPLSSIFFLPFVLDFMVKCFSSPYFSEQDLQLTLKTAFVNYIPIKSDEADSYEDSVHLKNILKSIVDYLTNTEKLARISIEIRVSKNFRMFKNKSDATILLHGITEKIMNFLVIQDDEKPSLIITSQRVDKEVLSFEFSGNIGVEQFEAPSIFAQELPMIKSAGYSLLFGNRKGKNIIQLVAN